MNRAVNATTTALKYFIGAYALVSHGVFTLIAPAIEKRFLINMSCLGSWKRFNVKAPREAKGRKVCSGTWGGEI
ncbi:MAG: hypothetical protein H0T62_13145 [Parachlamydiaceae bacterium]|nr:hypothetical protein [Parachlamydiaceae bacterium]